jgi:hypothetical protein
VRPFTGFTPVDRTRAALVCALALTGGLCIGVAVSDQRHAPAVALVTTTASTAAATPSAGAPSRRPPLILSPSIPTAIEIPAVRVRSALLQLDLAGDGSLAVPPPGVHYDQAGWYVHSPTPGALGPSVIVGHVDSQRGPSVFFRLGDVRPGDAVRVSRADGSVAVFAVDDVHRYHKTQFPTRLVYGNTDHAALRLVSCGGPFDRATGRYLDNVIVTASLVRTA